MNIGIIGVSGFTGLELVKILINHKKFKINYLGTTEGGIKIEELHQSLQNVYSANVSKSDIKEIAKKCEILFLALPHKSSMEYVKELLKFNLKIIDLSADYRLKQNTYEKFYVSHIDSENLKHAVYGIPELFREDIKKAKLIANAGCYPTASILGIVPFLKFKKDNSKIIIDAKSGVSGAGKKLSNNSHYVTINENMFAYSPMNHRHAPEIEEKISIFSNKKEQVIFIPHLVPVTRGMLASIYIEINQDIKINPLEILKNFYKNEKFIRIKEQPVSMKNVAGTHFCDIFAKYQNGIIYIETAIDNLLRGASSLAVANANLMAGFDENLGLPNFAFVP
jgi:N-acetyl-gamma-glutamyl-phosphate reductase